MWTPDRRQGTAGAERRYVNHWWQVPLYVSARGLTTSADPLQGPELRDASSTSSTMCSSIRTVGRHDRGPCRSRPSPSPPSMPSSWRRCARSASRSRIWTMPVEIPDPIALRARTRPTPPTIPTTSPASGVSCSRVDAVLKEFRGGFIGKSSPVHFFWGSFDLAVTRFSGRRAPPMPRGRPHHARRLSHEVSSVGWWPGDETATLSRLLRLRRARARGLRQGRGAAGGGLLRPRGRAVPPEVRRRARAPPRRARRCSTSARAPTRRRLILGGWNRTELERR